MLSLRLLWWLKPSRGIHNPLSWFSTDLTLALLEWCVVWKMLKSDAQADHEGKTPILLLLLATCLTTINALTSITDLTIVTAVLPLLQLLPASVFALCYQHFMPWRANEMDSLLPWALNLAYVCTTFTVSPSKNTPGFHNHCPSYFYFLSLLLLFYLFIILPFIIIVISCTLTLNYL